MVDGREYTVQEKRQLVEAYQSGEISNEDFMILQSEIKIYERHRAEGYLVEGVLDQDRLGVGLGIIVESYCRRNERPNRDEAVLNIPSIQWGDDESKVTPFSLQ